MSITKAQTVQYPVVASVSFTYADLTTTVVEDLCQIPAGATVVGGEIIVDTAWDSATSATLDIGDDGDDDRYTGTIINLKTAGRTALTLTGYKYTETDTVDATPTITGATTAGAARINIMYVVEGRSHEVQG